MDRRWIGDKAAGRFGMSPGWQVSLSCALSFGVPIAIGLRELWRLRRGGWRPEGSAAPPEPNRPITSAPSPGDLAPVGALPDCLVPARVPSRVRVLEDA
jgi:hypothetical protein